MDSESKRERFVRLAEARTNKILEMVKLLGNLSSTVSYDYNEEDVKQIFSAIKKELKDAENKFYGVDTKKDNKFKLK